MPLMWIRRPDFQLNDLLEPANVSVEDSAGLQAMLRELYEVESSADLIQL
jgi:hypothetical protein